MKNKARFPFMLLMGSGLMVSPLIAGAAQAQDQPGDRVNQLVIYGEDVCPQSTEGEIVVCARKDESERYRIPETLRSGGLGEAKNQAWSQRVKSYEYVGKSGAQTCSASGAFGFTGCTQRLLQQAYAEKGLDDTVNWGQLIEAERQKRLAGIDSDAEAVEVRLRAIETRREAQEIAAAEARARLDAQDAEALRAANGEVNSLAVPPGAEEVPTPTDDD